MQPFQRRSPAIRETIPRVHFSPEGLKAIAKACRHHRNWQLRGRARVNKQNTPGDASLHIVTDSRPSARSAIGFIFTPVGYRRSRVLAVPGEIIVQRR